MVQLETNAAYSIPRPVICPSHCTKTKETELPLLAPPLAPPLALPLAPHPQ